MARKEQSRHDMGGDYNPYKLESDYGRMLTEQNKSDGGWNERCTVVKDNHQMDGYADDKRERSASDKRNPSKERDYK